MTTTPVRDARWWLEQLEDPFTMFPVESVADTLFKAIDDAETDKMSHIGIWGVERKFWSVEMEHDYEKIGLLVGAIFVLGQAAITQTITILKELRNDPQVQSVIPKNKTSKLTAHAALETGTGLGKIVIINAVSNYFKHVYEWPDQWDIAPDRGAQAETINIMLQIGMKPGVMTDNLLLAAERLGLNHNNPRAVATDIQQWREGWARVLYPSFGLPDPNSSL